VSEYGPPPEYIPRGDQAPPNYGYTPQGDQIFFQTNERGDAIPPYVSVTPQGDLVNFDTNAHGDAIYGPADTSQSLMDRVLEKIRRMATSSSTDFPRNPTSSTSPSAHEIASHKLQGDLFKLKRDEAVFSTPEAIAVYYRIDEEVATILGNDELREALRAEWQESFGLEKMIARGYISPDTPYSRVDDIPPEDFNDEFYVAERLRSRTMSDKEMVADGYISMPGGDRSIEAKAALRRIRDTTTAKERLFERWFLQKLQELGISRVTQAKEWGAAMETDPRTFPRAYVRYSENGRECTTIK
jgi:hypothetical protein